MFTGNNEIVAFLSPVFLKLAKITSVISNWLRVSNKAQGK